MDASATHPRGLPVDENEAFQLLLSNSLSGFAVLTGKDVEAHYVFVSDSMSSLLKLDKSVLEGRALSDFLLHEDRQALADLLSSATQPPSPSSQRGQEPTAPYVRVRHACGDRHASKRLTTWKPVECRACIDTQGLVYLAMLDATMPAQADSRLSDLLAFASHDLRTPCSSILTTLTLIRGLPTVEADREAISLLETVDAACTVLLRCVANVLSTRSANRSEAEASASARTVTMATLQHRFNARECVESACKTLSALDSVPPRLKLVFDSESPLPEEVFGDESGLKASVQNIVMSAMRMGSWLQRDVPVRMRIAAEVRGPASVAPPVEGQTAGQEVHTGSVMVTFGSEWDSIIKEVMILCIVEVPGRPLTAAEVVDIMQPCGMMPADKGGSTGLPLHVACAHAKSTGGGTCALHRFASVPPRGADSQRHRPRPVDLEIYTTGENCTVFALHVLVHAAIDDAALQAAARGEAAPKPARMRDALRLAPPTLPPKLPSHHEGDIMYLTRHMFECLASNCADIFAICLVRLSEDSSALLSWLQYVSPSLQWVFGMQPASVFGRPLEELCHQGDRAGFAQALLAASESRIDVLYAHHGPGAHKLWCRTAGKWRGHTLYTVCRTRSLPVSVELGIRAFDVAVSHELREPVNTIVVSLQVLRTRPCMRDATEEAAREGAGAAAAEALGVAELMGIMLHSASLLEDIVGGIISTREIDAGDLVLKHSIFSPGAIIEGVVTMCRAVQPSGDIAAATAIVWEPRGISDAPAPLPPLVVGDRNKLALILQNLVTNAVKFSPAGSVVTVRAGSGVRPRGGPPHLVVTVTDTGRGMTPDEAKACFTAGTAAPTSQGGGTGLGLFLSRSFARLMGGELTVRTTLGEGATFRLELPLPEVDADTASTRTALAAEQEAEAVRALEQSIIHGQHAAMAAGVAEARSVAAPETPRTVAEVEMAAPRIRVLVADDHALNLRLMERLLTLNGFDVVGVGDGRAALDALIAGFSSDNLCDLCLLDMEMPQLSGPEVAAEFRKWEEAHRPGAAALPIVALTANVLDEHVEECNRAGMSLFFTKPLSSGDVNLLRAHAAIYIDQRRLKTAATEAELTGTAAAVAAAAETARRTLGLPAVARGAQTAKRPRL